jgi:hypothetical protein
MRDHPGCKNGEWKDSHVPLGIDGKPWQEDQPSVLERLVSLLKYQRRKNQRKEST